MIILKRSALCLVLVIGLAGCATLFGDEDNTAKPAKLTELKQDLTVHRDWSVKIGSGNNRGQFLRMAPSQYENTVYVAANNGELAAFDNTTGKTLWRVHTKLPLTTTPNSNGKLVVVGTDAASVVAFSAQDGHTVWTAPVSNAVLAEPTIADNQVFIKTIDDTVVALNTEQGAVNWEYKNPIPGLTLRASSKVKIAGDRIITGFSDGQLMALTRDAGAVIWKQTVAERRGASAVERMVDISADPLIDGDRVYVTTYQGNLAALRLDDGHIEWQHEFSSFSGMTLADNVLYATDAKGSVWAFQANDGQTLWRQEQLAARGLSAPVVSGKTIIVGDNEGYLHLLSNEDGHLRAREKVASSAITSEPVSAGKSITVFAAGVLSQYDLG